MGRKTDWTGIWLIVFIIVVGVLISMSGCDKLWQLSDYTHNIEEVSYDYELDSTQTVFETKICTLYRGELIDTTEVIHITEWYSVMSDTGKVSNTIERWIPVE